MGFHLQFEEIKKNAVFGFMFLNSLRADVALFFEINAKYLLY